MRKFDKRLVEINYEVLKLNDRQEERYDRKNKKNYRKE